MSLHSSKIQKIESLTAGEAKWLKLEKITYTDPENKERVWESASRSTRAKGSLIDGVGITAIFQPSSEALPDSAHPLVKQVQASGKPCILLQKQFRPPVAAVCIEVPAGLVDANESAEEAAARELKEETGYTGDIVSEGFGVSPVMWNDPGFCTTNLQMVHVTIDLSRPENQNPKPELEANEFIECFAVPLADLYAECIKLAKEGYAIDARVGTMAEGIEMAKRWNLK
ncbi:hypothetical protein EJ05DRAFT_32972 [Pseudovirgaria hyperparasitica]|uniref:Nudix hydrolase domain-containing protein n=1 Tax=Pseudovirgaria hyperparasitica TaxID=470096 RepID=A0A6A6WMD0_9PEZI|nr:uncharacterized protein EJ05DRAFT_32972 [Pseudovirgaria hyperparasitica]KAF2763286.1 hypothetical protein EJ05DRAFT_32972 [Pseudovirgaria hyperparasitica]